jgi:Zn-finger protein
VWSIPLEYTIGSVALDVTWTVEYLKVAKGYVRPACRLRSCSVGVETVAIVGGPLPGVVGASWLGHTVVVTQLVTQFGEAGKGPGLQVMPVPGQSHPCALPSGGQYTCHRQGQELSRCQGSRAKLQKMPEYHICLFSIISASAYRRKVIVKLEGRNGGRKRTYHRRETLVLQQQRNRGNNCTYKPCHSTQQAPVVCFESVLALQLAFQRCKQNV